MKIGLVNPGAMGASLGAALVRSGHNVLWQAAGRSPATQARAEAAGLTPVQSIDALAESEALLSVCPPDAALSVAETVLGAGFDGLYVDANAVAPMTAKNLAVMVGSRFVDGGIIGPPAARPGTTRLYLSGEHAAEVCDWFSDPVLGVHVVPGEAGAASALKMCFAAYTKGTSALLLAIRALATAEGVDEALLAEWAISQPDLALRSEGAARGTAGKAWRFVGEMEEIAATFADNALPGDFHEAAAEIYQRMAPLKDAADADLAAVLARLLARECASG
ncbi:MAG: DUF1932 domain-containing protein [Pseudomonadota bacterium]